VEIVEIVWGDIMEIKNDPNPFCSHCIESDCLISGSEHGGDDCCEMVQIYLKKTDNQKLRAFCEGLEMQNIDKILEHSPEDLKILGAAMLKKIKEKIND